MQFPIQFDLLVIGGGLAAFKRALHAPGVHLIEAIVPPNLSGIELRAQQHLLKSLENPSRPVADGRKRKIAK